MKNFIIPLKTLISLMVETKCYLETISCHIGHRKMQLNTTLLAHNILLNALPRIRYLIRQIQFVLQKMASPKVIHRVLD